MRLLIANPPWPGLPAAHRLGCEQPGPALATAGVPWPDELAYLTASLRQAGHEAWLVDAGATGESVASFHQRLAERPYDAVVLATHPASLAADLPLIERTAAVRPTFLAWFGPAGEAAALTAIPGLRAVVAGDLLTAVPSALPAREVVAVDGPPWADLASLPLPYRDYSVHRYRYPLAGQPAGPQLVVRACYRDRPRPAAAIAAEIEFCRRQYPRLTQVVLVDRIANRYPEFAAVAAVLESCGLPWSARVALTGAWPEQQRSATALEVSLPCETAHEVVEQLQQVAAAGVALSLLPAADTPAAETAALAGHLGATALDPVPPPSGWPAAADLVARRQVALATAPARPQLFVVGQHLPVYMPPWLCAAAEELGFASVAIDPFQEPRDVKRLLDTTPDDHILFDRGHAFPPGLLPRIGGRKVLYYPDVLPQRWHGGPPLTYEKYREFVAVAPLFDDVILHDNHALDFLQAAGHRNIRGVVMLPYDPTRHRDLGLPRDTDLLFVGMMSPHREACLARLQQAGVPVTVLQVWGEEFVRTLNRAKLVLNLHYVDQPNTELRIVEATACGAMVLSEPTTTPYQFQPGEHLDHFTFDNITAKVEYWLSHESERQGVVARCQELIAAEHTALRCLQKILALLPEKP